MSGGSNDMPPSRSEIVQQIMAAKVGNGLRWTDVAEALETSKEWAAAACLGQMTMAAEQADAAVELFGLPAEASAVLQVPPSRGSLDQAVPSDPLIYRFYEVVSVYGTTLKELIHEEFGDGIMSAIDFRMNLEREPDPAGDRVRITMSGKFLPYRTY
ncbi:cyanase [Amycolatopsis sp. NPDC047767]|uniref:cyanase n=1 Tax=Amycolatopsis sp. NPDC047767 TaxID=3156765 RepID=UPI0034548538